MARIRSLTHLEERFIRSGFEGLEDREVIELLFALVVPLRKSRELAQECIERFGSLRGLLAASSEQLQGAGVNLHCICGVKLLREFPIEGLKQKMLERPIHGSSKKVFDYLSYSMRDFQKEVFRVIYLNTRNQITDTVDLFEGTLDSIPIRPREIVESAIQHSATRLIFAHNHPSGDISPSRSDKQLTRDLVFIGNVMEIKVLDHIIVGDDGYFSFADEGLIQKYNDDFLNMRIRALSDTRVTV